MSVKGKKRDDWVARSFCDYNNGSRSELRRHFTVEAGQRAFKGFVKDVGAIWGHIWLEMRDGTILRDTRPLVLSNAEQVKQLKNVLKEMLTLMSRVSAFNVNVGINHDIASALVALCTDGKNKTIVCDQHSDPMLTIGDAAVICCGIRQESNEEVMGFVVGKNVYYPGIYRYPDGSGEPPSEDFSEEYSTRSPREAAVYLLKTIFDIELSMAAESIGEEEMTKEMAKDAEEAFA